MNRSILVDVRSACNLEEDDSSFDKQLIPLINTQIMMAHQFGVGWGMFSVTDENQTWADWVEVPGEDLRAIKTWLGYSVMLMFDPPENGTVLKAYQDMLAKMEWMLREKTEEKGYVKMFVPEKADFYEDEAESSSGEEPEPYDPGYDYPDEPIEPWEPEEPPQEPEEPPQEPEEPPQEPEEPPQEPEDIGD